ncbi:MAG: hypothetical protein J6B19_00530 [Lachnospiraceae bacterium]|nr:hypothetical protein [Lachnospiraceae bacterium]
MNQLDLINALFTEVKKIKQYMIYHSSKIKPEEYLVLLSALLEKYYALSLPSAGIETTLKSLESAKEITNPSTIYLRVINCMLREIILYRKQFCIIRRSDPIPGLASHIMTNLGQIVAAINEGYIPVIDMQFSENLFTCLNQNHTQNAWELFFKQPFGNYSLYVATNADTRILKDGIPGFMPYYNMDQLMNPSILNFWQTAMKEYMPFSDRLQKATQDAYGKLPFEGNKILGVICRGTDYRNLRPYNHPVQPDVNDVIAKAKETMQNYNCTYCYLATEDDSIRARFQETFGDRLLTSQSMYFDSSQATLLSEEMQDSPKQLLEKNVEYLTSLFLLGQCHCLIGGRTSGLVVALLLNEIPYAYTYFWNEGNYGIDSLQALQTLSIATTL